MSAPPYRVQLSPLPIVVDAGGSAVADSHVIEITFPGGAIQTALGPVNIIVGPGVAKVIVGETTIRGVPLC